MTGILLLSIAIIWSWPIFWGYRGLTVILVIVYGGFIMRQFVLLINNRSIKAIHYQNDRQWLVHTNAGDYFAKVLGSSTVTNLVSVLRFKVMGKQKVYSCVIFFDSLSTEDYRRLVVQLRMG